MEPYPLELPFLSNIGLLLTFKCTTACPHCVVEAGPHRKEEMLLEQAFSWIEQARAYGNGCQIVGLALTGGEPFCILDKLIQVSNYGQQLGFIVSVVTNAYWASTEEAALAVLQKLPAVRMLSISTDAYHQKTIPLQFAVNAARAAHQLGWAHNLAVCTDNEENPDYKKTIQTLTDLGEGDRIRPAITYPVGRAQNLASHFNYEVTPAPPVSACTMASSPIIFPDGKVLACIGPLVSLPPGHPLYLGNLQHETLAEVLDRAESNPILHAIRIWGPHKLASILAQHGYGDRLPPYYLSRCICDICYKLFLNADLLEDLNAVMLEPKMMEMLAYARVFYMHEDRMAIQLHLDDESKQRV
jgi:organic radical activating enzyme